VAGNANVLRFVASGAYQYVAQALSGSAPGVIRRSVSLIDKATANAANLSYLVGATAQDMIVKSTVGDVAFGAVSSGQPKVNVNGGSVVAEQDAAVNLTNLYSGITRRSAALEKAAFLVQPVTLTVAAPASLSSAKGVVTYTYNATTKAFTPVTTTARKVSTGANAVIDVKTATKQVAYFDSNGGFWMVG
jgi:hypothetical protein